MILEEFGCRVVIDPTMGGRLTSVQIQGWELLVGEGVDDLHWGNFVLAPWTGRLRHGILIFEGKEYQFRRNAPPHALHGLVAHRAWKEVRPGVVTVDLLDPWPWRGRVTHEVVLHSGRLDFILTLEADEPMPAAMGWHPWFPRWLQGPSGRIAGPVEIEVDPTFMYSNDDEGLPNGKLVQPAALPWDYCFRDLKATPRLRWAGAVDLSIESDCPDWVIYDQEPEAICVEPWTAPPNSINTPGTRIVTPDAPLMATMTWHWRMLG